MSETPTGTDRVELTEDDKDTLCEWSDRFAREVVADDAWPQLVAAVESIVAARVAALTAERDELEHDLNNEAWANEKAKRDLDAARAELAAANARAKDADEWQARMVLAHTALEARCAELEASAQQEYDWQQKRTDEFTGTLSNVVASSEAELILLRDENAALQATLDRVTTLADGWAHDGPDDSVQIFITRLRAALTPEGKP